MVQIYGTGFGPVTNQPATGAAASASPLSQTILTPTVTIGGVPAHVLFSGLTPTSVGLNQIKAEVPAGVTGGNAVPVIVSIGRSHIEHGHHGGSILRICQSTAHHHELYPSASGAAGTSSLALTINGTGFVSASSVKFNGISHTAAFVSNTQLTISLSASDLATPGNFPVTVINPAPGGGNSPSAAFTVTPPVLLSLDWKLDRSLGVNC